MSEEHTERTHRIPITEQCYNVGSVFSGLMGIMAVVSFAFDYTNYAVAFGLFALVLTAFALLMYFIDPYHKEAIGYND